ncbi:hypothetical protein [Piscibacillus salipiscarius]|uniref:hypothetical protein n=1 Tax=Piscibacillus salipiscarius TaxID=299480 RepID=UPI0006CFD807|nr:hypothetical protein [Piscibacillus salipiscarius]
MNFDRKEVIIKEIKYWKESKLLPEKYCDFLLMLYTQGEGNSESEVSKKQSNIWYYIDLTFLVLLLPVSTFLLLNDEFQQWVKLFVIIFTVSIASFHMLIFYRLNQFIFHLSIIVLLSIVLTGSLNLNIIFNLGIHPALITLINCFAWITIGFGNDLVI